MKLLLGIPLLILSLLAMSFAQGANGQVKGEVWFKPFNESRNAFEIAGVPNCEVRFQSKTVRKMATTDKDGRYTVDLPAGMYTATTQCALTSSKQEYHPAVRPDFEVKPNANVLINLKALIKRIPDPPEYRKDDIRSETLEVKGKTGPSRKVLIRYTRRASAKELAEYQGKRDYRQDAPVSLTYDVLSISADSMIVEKPMLHIRAVGHVVFEDGTRRQEGSEATIEMDAANPIATLNIK